MEIDWFTFAAQIVNFLILVALLKRFLFRPVVRAMQEREENIAERIEEAERKQAAAEEEAENFRRKNEELDRQREDLMARAGREVEQWRKEQIEQARNEVERARSEWYRALEREREQFLRELGQRVGQQACKAARRIVSQVADTELEQKIVESFLRRLQSMDESRRPDIMQGLHETDHPLVVSTAFELDDRQRDRVRQTLAETLTDHAEVNFRTDPDLICGIELKVASHKVAWSIREHLDSLEEELGAVLEEGIPQSSTAG